MQSTIVRTQVAGSPEVKWCVDCTKDVRLVRSAGYGGQDLICLATERRGNRDICGRHARMYDDLAAEVAADEAIDVDADLFALVEATVWADDPWAPALAEIDEAWYGAVAS